MDLKVHVRHFEFAVSARVASFAQRNEQIIVVVPWWFKLLERFDKMILSMMDLQVVGSITYHTSFIVPPEYFLSFC